MTTSMIAVSVSTRKAQSKASSPDCIHVRTGTTVASALPLTKPRKIGQLKMHATNSEPVVTAFAKTLGALLLTSPATIAASKGRKTMKRMEVCTDAYPFIRLASSTAIVPRPRK